MNRSPVLLIGFTLCVAGLLSAGTARETKEAERLENATVAINEIMQSPDNGIPQDLLDRAVCAGIVPSEKKLAFIFGGNYGRGALVCRIS